MTAGVKNEATGLRQQTGRSTDHRISVRYIHYTPQCDRTSSPPVEKQRASARFAWEKQLPAWMCHYLWRRAMVGWVSINALAYKLETAEQTIEWRVVEAGIRALGLERRT